MIKNRGILVVEKFDDIPFKHCDSFGRYKNLSMAKYIVKRLNRLNVNACIWKWNREDPVPSRPFHVVAEHS